MRKKIKKIVKWYTWIHFHNQLQTMTLYSNKVSLFTKVQLEVSLFFMIQMRWYPVLLISPQSFFKLIDLMVNIHLIKNLSIMKALFMQCWQVLMRMDSFQLAKIKRFIILILLEIHQSSFKDMKELLIL